MKYIEIPAYKVGYAKDKINQWQKLILWLETRFD